jgi:hypothetical protein
MAARWEYLSVRWHQQRHTPSDPNEESAEWTNKSVTEIWWPRSTEPEVIATETWSWSKGMSEWKKEKWGRMPSFFNELGADGWECYSTQVLSSAVWPRDGYETASHPLEMRFYFKREQDA